MTSVARIDTTNLPGHVRKCQPATNGRPRHGWSMRLLGRSGASAAGLREGDRAGTRPEQRPLEEWALESCESGVKCTQARDGHVRPDTEDMGVDQPLERKAEEDAETPLLV